KYWLIGFTEGDGCFYIYKDKYLTFKITQSSGAGLSACCASRRLVPPGQIYFLNKF
uniref:hypothetical protein n=1 Tax=Aspergillus sclerotioniger TaxID=319627 RepID=UPI002114C73C